MKSGRVESVEQLELLYRTPSPIAAAKVFPSITDEAARFVDSCPFIVLATSDGRGSVDASPRGGPPGFVQRLDDRHIAIPDLNGNNRLDSLRNVVVHSWAGILMIIPGKDETLRINGPAYLTTEPEVLAGFTQELRTPKLAVVIEATEVYGHCAKAFRRSRMWEPRSWEDGTDAPDLVDLYACAFNLEEGEMRTALEASYVSDLAQD